MIRESTTPLVLPPELVGENTALLRRILKVCAAFAVWLAVGSAFALTNAPASAFDVYSVLVDGRAVEDGRLHVSSSAQRLEFRFGPNPLSSNPPVRLRYQLEGFDKDWREAGGEMRLNLRFLDASGNTVSAQDFVLKGESVGWAGAVLRSRFNRRNEQVSVPERAVRMQLEFFSGGSEQTVGVLVIDDLTVSRAAGASGEAEALLFSSHLAEGKDLDQSSGVPRGWMRDGSKPSGAQIIRSDDDKPLHFLAVVDTDPTTWGAWRTDPESSVAVQPRETLNLRWNEMYSIGWGGAAEANYSYLPQGQYQFRVRGVTENGEWTGETYSLPVIVAPPFWRTSWFRGAILVGLVAALVAALRYQMWRKMQLRLELLDRERAVELERTRIARDIHDDLGANLTQIALLSELARTDLDQPEQAKSHLERIFTTAGAVARQLDEIVWAITPANDTLEQFVSYMCKFAQDYLRVAGIRCRLDVPESLPKYPMSSAKRHDLFLAAKEALHNVVKHARAEQVWLRLSIQKDELTLMIEDNGKGLRQSDHYIPRGHGLTNMQSRLQHAGGTFEHSSQTGHGTLVRLVLPLKPR